MESKLKMSVIMAAVDKITAPIKKVTQSTTKLVESMQSTQTELDKISRQQRDIEHFKELKRAISKLKPELKQQQSLVNRLASEYENAEKPTAKMKQELAAARQKLNGMTGSLRDNLQKLRSSSNGLRDAGIKTNQLAAHTKKLQQQTDKYNASLAKTKAELQKVADHEKRLKAAQEKRGKAIAAGSNMAIAGAGTMYASQQTIAGIKAPLQSAANFEAQMSKVRAISKASEDQMKQMSGQARQLGAETAYSASEVASAQEFLAVAGFDTNKILAATPDTLKLAQAGNIDLARAADIASDALTAFNMDAGEMGRMADVLALTSTTANTNVGMMGESLKTSAGVAGSFGGTIEQVSAMLGIMANSGIKGAQAGTALASMYSRISADKGAQKALNELGVEAFDAEGKLRAMPEIINDIGKATAGMSDNDTSAYFKSIFGAEAGAMAGSKALLKAANDDSLLKYVKRLEEAKGTAGKTAAEMSDNLTGTIKSWDSAMESLQISAGTALIPTMRELTAWVTGLTRKIDTFAKNNPTLVKWLGIAAIAFAAITAVLGPLMIMMGSLIGSYATLNYALAAASAASARFNIVSALGSGVMKALAAAQWLVNAAMTANPIGLVIVAVAALIGLAMALVDDWGAVGQWFLDLWEGIKAGIGKAVDFIKAYFEALLNPIATLQKAFGMISDFFSGDDEKTVAINKKVKQVEEAAPALKEVNKTSKGAVGPAVATALTASTAALPAVANDHLQVVPATPLAQQQAKQVQVDGDQVAINISAAPGMDGQQVAAMVRHELQRHQDEKQRKLRGALHDGD